jgi:hypothetical protein
MTSPMGSYYAFRVSGFGRASLPASLSLPSGGTPAPRSLVIAPRRWRGFDLSRGEKSGIEGKKESVANRFPPVTIPLCCEEVSHSWEKATPISLPGSLG